MKRKIISINPKSYLYGEELIAFGLFADQLAKKYNKIDVYFCCPFVHIQELSKKTEHLIIAAQSMDPVGVGSSMGKVFPESLVNVGCKAVVLNHNDKPMTTSELVSSFKICRNLKLKTMICAGDLEEVEMISVLRPDIMICETHDSIGQGISSSSAYMIETKRMINKHSKSTKIIQGGGIMDEKDITKAIVSGADGVGMTSGIVCASNPFEKLKRLIQAVDKIQYK